MEEKQYKLHDLTAIVVLVGVSLIGCFGFTLILGNPLPVFHDEFSYLLMGETIANGSWADQSHPFKEFFVSFHILQDPTYASKYLPLNGLILSIGFLLDLPVFGVWLSVAFMACSFYYAAKSVSSNTVAFILAVWGSFYFGVLSYWSHSFWGGAGCAAGGSLVLGGCLHYVKKRSLFDFVWVAVGIVILILSRPFEGFFFCLPIGSYLSFHCWKRYREGAKISTIFLPLLIPLFGVLVGLSILAWQNDRVTGHWDLFPHTLFQDTYFPKHSRFSWDSVSPSEEAVARPDVFDNFADASRGEEKMTFSQAVGKYWISFGKWWSFYMPFAPMVILLLSIVSGVVFIQKKFLLFLVILLFRWIPYFLAVSTDHLHYTAAWACVSIVIIAVGVESIGTIVRENQFFVSRHLGKFFRLWPLYLLFPMVVYSFVFLATGSQIEKRVPSSWTPGSWNAFATYRSNLINDLVANYPDAEHLVFVEYGDKHNIHQEWVYNGFDIDSKKVIFARDLGKVKNQKLTNYYSTRMVWKLAVNKSIDFPVLSLLD